LFGIHDRLEDAFGRSFDGDFFDDGIAGAGAGLTQDLFSVCWFVSSMNFLRLRMLSLHKAW
jgi:hypothetical protein